MSTQKQRLLEQISQPSSSHAADLLSSLGLSGLPPREQVHKELEDKLLLPKENLPEHWLPTYQIHWDHQLSAPSLLTLEPSPPPTTLAFVRAGLQGRVTGYTEASTTCIRELSSRNRSPHQISNPRIASGLTSTSLDRAPGPSNSFVRGKAGYVPFWPGGLEDARAESKAIGDLSEQSKGLRKLAPGLSRGLTLPGDEDEEHVLNDLDDLQQSNGEDERIQENSHSQQNGDALIETSTTAEAEIDEFLPTTRSHLSTIKTSRRPLRRANIQKRDWAHVVDVNKPMTNFHEMVPDMAHEYPFELDTFQKEAVYHLEMGDSVFVAAHTSAGKTVVAEYAIALAGKHMTRAIYTSPIKALSNQKYRDFKQTFSSSSVGILTGDVQINPEANCLIMTTEILRSMLYKGADLIRDVEFVIFDEVHYVNDAERGVVWEEVIIMLPDHVNIILLSATVPNTKEFADWVGRTKKKDIYVISTAKRPVPLEHYLYAGRDLHRIVDASRNFDSQGYKAAGEALRRKQDKEREAAGLPPVQRLGARAAAPQRGQRGGPGGRGGQHGGTPARGGPPVSRGGSPRTFHQPDKNLYVHLIGHLRKKSLLPVVVFTLSKKRCEENAGTLTNLYLCTAVEKSEIHVTIEKALSRLKDTDRKLPQIRRMRDLLSRGIGVHHGGLLPIVKEVVEILFARGLVKVLFATETFAMGVNMPTRCVVFSNIRKHDGRSFRDILPGEYTQMAGRAGRRGLDATGTVIIVANDSLPEQTTLYGMVLGTPSKLQSQFRLTYNMILNLLRVEALRVEEMIKRSFSENSSQKLLPEQQKQVIASEKVLSARQKLSCDVCSPDIERFYDLSDEIVSLNQRILTMAVGHPQGAKLLSSGRVVVLRDGHFKWNIGVIVKSAGAVDNVKTYFVLAMVDPDTKAKVRDVDADSVPPRWPPRPESLIVDSGTYELAQLPIASIAMVTTQTIKVDVPMIVPGHRIAAMKAAVQSLSEVLEQWLQSENITEAEWTRIRTLEFQETLRLRNQLVERLDSCSCTQCSDFDDHYITIHGEKFLKAKIAELKRALSDQNLELIPDYEQKIAVLQELKFIDDNSTVLLKGRVACEASGSALINSANELILTELILENTLAQFDPEEVAALLSCFVFQEKTEVEPVIPPKLEEGREAIMAIAERIGAVQSRHKVPGEEFRGLKFGLMEVVYEWAKGMPFEQITELTDVAEGTVVRVITRLDETCREVRDAARVIGDAELFKKMEETQIKIKRDIVFAASLYF
ncbi:antiviral helicase [Wolfiporia cocos MD-104 SS10]|uniref:Antiviral helicase n=1 Tax=Wolfiporia cocos (strain MD-104) TaxID=742152 RepID=A0A2H3JDR1_WOLCO|nr:antiviral helicase [Wolfiporia cocos MD-104 SS10]